MLNKLIDKYDDMDNGELNELNSMLVEFKENIHKAYSFEHPIRLKYDKLCENFERTKDLKKSLDNKIIKSKIVEGNLLYNYKPLIQFNSNFFPTDDFQNASTSNSEIIITNMIKDFENLNNLLPSFEAFDFTLTDNSPLESQDLLLDYEETNVKPKVPFYRKTRCKGGRGGKGLGKGGAKRARIGRRKSESRSCSRSESSAGEIDSSDYDRSSSSSRNANIHNVLDSTAQNNFPVEDDELNYSEHEFFKEWKKSKKQIDCNKKYWTNNENLVFRSFLLSVTKVK
jgi:hypothetical protein